MSNSNSDLDMDMLNRQTDSMENIQLYLMQISLLMKDLKGRMLTFGNMIETLHHRMEKVEQLHR
jgi:hypothetical protein